ncbi:GDSL-type esterase/lipase family protein [Flavobacterium sp. RHBU_3]|uniref:GDSL-type esterase/lipase family protein n=1 Tax=Flavobacterium sp. RHBU_3 TaxID=3391184 RepID=UPI003985150C
MHSKLTILIALLLAFTKVAAQTPPAVTETATVVTDSLADIDTTDVPGNNVITNSHVMRQLFEKLYKLEQTGTGKINIVHIGDSHIQADLMTNAIRKRLQKRFGNGGGGFTFPHQLARTNGSYNTRFKSNASWASRRNILPVDPAFAVGLSGIALETRENFVVELNVRDSSYDFNTIRIVTPNNQEDFDLATSSRTIVLESTEPKKITHRIKNGEVLGSIANKYNVSVADIKRANSMKTDRIRAGKTLKIPTDEKVKRDVKRSEFIPLTLQNDTLTHYYYSKQALDKIYLLPHPGQNEYNLSGLVLENDTPGLLYHSIGVNGAKASDYNKYPLFFQQLPALKPDLVVVSLGTNESFDKMTEADYMAQLNTFINNVKANCPNTAILIMTPPPSLFRRKYPNTFAASYAGSIIAAEEAKQYATWDLFTEFGGLYGVPKNAKRGLINTDRVHYTKQGYEKQGRLFSEAFINAYDYFKSNRDK